MSGGNRELVPPDPIPNSEVKRLIADDSVGLPHVKVGHCQTLIQKPGLYGRVFFRLQICHCLSMIKGIFISFLLRKFIVAASIPLIALFVAVGLDFSTYHALTDQQKIFSLKVIQVDDNLYDVELISDDYRKTFSMAGDQWQLDARLIRFTPTVALTGLTNLFQPSRLSSRYDDIADQKALPLSFYSLREFEKLDSWKYLKRYDATLPFIDSVYGSSVYMPLEDDAEYEIVIGFSGLVVRSVNDSAKTAVHNWQ